jgi:hypothetical protein
LNAPVSLMGRLRHCQTHNTSILLMIRLISIQVSFKTGNVRC